MDLNAKNFNIDIKPKKGTGAGSFLDPFAIPRSTLFMALAVLSILLVIMTGLTVFLLLNISATKKKMMNNANVIQKVLETKTSLNEKVGELQARIDELSIELQNAKRDAETAAKKTEKLSTDLGSASTSEKQLNDKLKKYADDIQELASKKIAFYSDYKESKQRLTEYEALLAQRDSSILELKKKVDAFNGVLEEKERTHTYDIAVLYARSGYYKESLETFSNYLRMNGPDASTYFNMAYIYDHIYGDPFKAIKFYREYLTLKPEAADLYEVEQRIESLERGSKVKSPETLKNFNVNMDNLKF